MPTESSYDFDLITIGAGSGGVRASRIAAGHGARVAIIEEDRPGGTCVLRGCVPKKLMVYGSAFSAEASDAIGFGWDELKPSHNWQHLMKAKDKELDRLAGIYSTLLSDAGVVLIEGRGVVTGKNSVAVGDKTYTAERILIAVGGWPYKPDIEGFGTHTITSNEALTLPRRPDEVVIFGAGYIAVEFAGIFNGFGAKTHLVYRSPLPLRGFDQDLCEGFAVAALERGVILHPNTTISSVDSDGDMKAVNLSDGTTIKADAVMVATGRRPMTEGLGLAELGVDLAPNGAIMVNSSSQTNIESIYAIGDATDRINLTPVAIAEGHMLADRLYASGKTELDYDNIPSAVFCQPPIGSVGLSEEAVRDQGIEPQIFVSSFRAMKNTISGRDEKTLMKLIVDPKTDVVLGAHMLGEASPEIIQGVAIAIKSGAKKADFDATMGIHPTSAEEFVTMRNPRA